mmetsp:Transcript_21734/g.68830  ORF Transcript_21734/g.68830 Transcript_21734/m.68830 type:complete len:204 (-) Transcript_21734:322-933(-)
MSSASRVNLSSTARVRQRRRQIARLSSCSRLFSFCSSAMSMSARLRLKVASVSRSIAISSRAMMSPRSRSAETMPDRSRYWISSSIRSSARSSLSRHFCSASSTNLILSNCSSMVASNSLTCASSLSLSSLRSEFSFLSSSHSSWRSSNSSRSFSSVLRESWLAASSSSSSWRPTVPASSFLLPRTMPARSKVFFVATFESLG